MNKSFNQYVADLESGANALRSKLKEQHSLP